VTKDPITVDIRPPKGATMSFPGWTLQGHWNPNEAERLASWDILVELVTRISVVPLGDDQGILREALSSLHALFGSARATLQRHGPTLAEERRGELSFAVICAHMLNGALRPVLVEWHPKLKGYEVASGSAAAPSREMEALWPDQGDLRRLLRELQAVLVRYAVVFAEACGAREFVRFLLDDHGH
jgi:hypothetical protein